MADAAQYPEGLDAFDVDGDGTRDLLAGNHWCKYQGILYGNGRGGFTTSVVTKGDGWHEGKLGDFDGDGDLDLLNKPYTWNAPRIDLWLNGGRP